MRHTRHETLLVSKDITGYRRNDGPTDGQTLLLSRYVATQKPAFIFPTVRRRRTRKKGERRRRRSGMRKRSNRPRWHRLGSSLVFGALPPLSSLPFSLDFIFFLNFEGQMWVRTPNLLLLLLLLLLLHLLFLPPWK